MRSSLARIASAVCVCIATIAISSARAENPSERADSIEAVWKAQSILFDYRSGTRLYPCDVLEGKIRMILLRLGARDHLKLRRYACTDHGARARFEVLMESPVEATEENIRAITTYDSTDELVARLNATPLPTAQDVPRFSAAWQPISLHRDRKLYLTAGDCALVLQLRQQILSKMSVQVTKDIEAADCFEELQSMGAPRLAVVALVPVQEAP